MPHDSSDDPKQLGYQAKPTSNPKKKLSLEQLTLLTGGLGACIGFALMRFSYAFGFTVALLSFGTFVALSIYRIFKERSSHQTEEDYESEWNLYESRKNEMLKVAKEVYANGPIGTWRRFHVTIFRVNPVLEKEWLLSFTLDGKGHYSSYDKERSPHSFNTEFTFQPDGDGAIMVQLTKPPLDDKFRVSFSFDVNRKFTAEPALHIYFEPETPVPDTLVDHWPFAGEFLQEATTA